MTVPIGGIAGFIRIAGAAQAQQDLNRVRASMAGTGEAAGAAATQLGRTDAALVGAGRASNTASSGAAKFRVAQLSATAATERYNALLLDETTSLARLASAEASVIRANERLRATTPVAAIAPVGPATTTAASGMARFGASMGSAGKMAVGLGATLGAFELVKKAIDITKQASAFQQSMLLIQTNANASASEVQHMTAAVLGMAGPVATAPDQLANALYHVEQNGLRGSKALEALTVGAQGAKIGMADVEDTTNTMTIALASGIDGVQNLQQAMGVMIATVGTGDMRFSDLNDALSGGLLTTAKNFGATTRDVGAALATLGDNGIRGKEAATGMRQAMMGFAAPAAKGKDALDSVGLSMTALRDDMSKHGLTHAFNDLEQHMAAAGVTGNKVGGFITQAFGRKAGNSIGVIVGEIDRLNTKFDENGKAAGSFAAKWQATTQTASFAFQKLGAEIEAGGIVLANKLMPAVTTAARWLGTALPHALSVLGTILAPTVHMIGTGLATAWHDVVAILGPVATMLGHVGHVLADNADAIGGVTKVLLIMFAAWKGAQIAALSIGLLSTALQTLVVRTGAAVEGMAALRAGTAAVSMRGFALGVAAAGVAVYELGSHISAYLERNDSLVKIMPHLTDDMNSWRDALVASNGALNDSIRLSIEKQLQDSGLAQKAAAAGISLGQLTAGVTGTDAATQALVATWRASGSPADNTIAALGMLHYAYRNASGGADQLRFANDKNVQMFNKLPEIINRTAAATTFAAADQRRWNDSMSGVASLVASNITGLAALVGVTHGADAATRGLGASYHWVVTSSGALAQTTGSVSAAADAATKALDAQTAASTRLKQAQDLLNGVNQSLESTTDAFSIALGGLRDKTSLATDANGKLSSSLDQTTVAGATNRQMLLGLITQAQSQAQSTADQAYALNNKLGPALKAGNTQLGQNEAAIRKAALAAGFSAGEVDKMIHSLGIVSKISVHAAVGLYDKASTPLQNIRSALEYINGRVFSATVQINEALTTSGAPAVGTGHHLAYGGTVTGAGGPKADAVPIMASHGEEVIQNPYSAQYRPLLKAINAGAGPRFATGGTVGRAPSIMSNLPAASKWDDSRIIERLDALEQAVRESAGEFAREAVVGYERAGTAQAQMMMRIGRK